jgi:hypothetical protein
MRGGKARASKLLLKRRTPLKAHTWTILEQTEASEAASVSVEDERSEWRRRSRHCSRFYERFMRF